MQLFAMLQIEYATVTWISEKKLTRDLTTTVRSTSYFTRILLKHFKDLNYNTERIQYCGLNG